MGNSGIKSMNNSKQKTEKYNTVQQNTSSVHYGTSHELLTISNILENQREEICQRTAPKISQEKIQIDFITREATFPQKIEKSLDNKMHMQRLNATGFQHRAKKIQKDNLIKNANEQKKGKENKICFKICEKLKGYLQLETNKQ